MRDQRTVFVVDDDPGMRNSLGMTLQAASLVPVTYGSAEEFLAAWPQHAGGCLVLDLRLPGMSGLQLLEEMQSRGSRLPVVMMTGHGDIAAAVSSMKLGAVDFLEKPVDPRALIEIVKAALRDDPERDRRRQIADAKRRLASLTTRELELLQSLALGKSSKQIAFHLTLSQKTVENHRSHLLAKAHAENIADLIRLATLAELV